MTRKPAVPAILIRGEEADDWEDVASIRDGPNVIYHTLQIPYLSRDVVRDKLENPPAGDHTLVAVVNDRVVGVAGLRVGTGRRAHSASLGMMVHEEFQGQGIGAALVEAAVNLAENWLNVSRIALEVFTDNAPALALYEKFGFVIEGTMRDYAFRDGRFVDTYLMARIRQTGQEKPGQRPARKERPPVNKRHG